MGAELLLGRWTLSDASPNGNTGNAGVHYCISNEQ